MSLVGDGELDEGSIWETVAEPALAGLDNVIWVVDVNRQSLDRVIPGIRIRQLAAMFRDNGWHVVEAKYGRRLEEASRRAGGDRLCRRIDEMSNEEYQFLLRAPAAVVRSSLGSAFEGYEDEALPALIADLGGHDFDVLREAFRTADGSRQPAVIFAYTVKGWGLPIAGDPLNHQALLTSEQVAPSAGSSACRRAINGRAFPRSRRPAGCATSVGERWPTHLGSPVPPPRFPMTSVGRTRAPRRRSSPSGFS